MGIPYYFYHLTKKYKNIIVNDLPEKIDNYYIDFNGVIHPECHKLLNLDNYSEELLIEKLWDKINNYNFKPHLCRNCGLIGHIYKNCPHPIMSFGIICYKIDENNEMKFLMIQRKDSLSFMEFIRGKYELNNLEYIKQLLLNMTISEREMIITLNFDDIWKYLWIQNENNVSKNNISFF